MKNLLKYDGFLYYFIYACWGDYSPQRGADINLCRAVWRGVASLFIGWPIVVPVMFLMFAQIPIRDGRREWRNWPGPDGAGPIPVLFFGGVILGLIACMIYDAGILLGFAAFPSFADNARQWPAMAFLFGCISWLIVLGFAVFLIMDKINQAREMGRWANEIRPSNVLSKFLKAKKQKLCPMIKIV